MKLTLLKFFLLLLFSNGFASDTVDTDIVDNIRDVMNGLSVMSTVTCMDPKPNDFQMYLYTKDLKEPILLNTSNLEVLDTKKKTVVITHGWLCSAFQLELANLRDAYLKRYDYNIIMVHWHDLAWSKYTDSVCKLPKIGRLVADYLCTAREKGGLDFAKVHLVGHSLGGQMSGFIGQSTQEICNTKVARITGLDPAGPLYFNTPKSKRLDSTDANFVDVLHTNGGAFGYYESCGHADFYINCGSTQEQCRKGDINQIDLIHLSQELGLCEHLRALHVMAEGVLTDNFKATSCPGCPLICPPLFAPKDNYVTMGEECPPTAKGGYYIKTNYKSPYAITPNV